MEIPVFNDAFDAWNFLQEHPIFKEEESSPLSYFESCLSIEVVKVNPESEKREEDEEKNSVIRVWLECGPSIKSSKLTEKEQGHPSVGRASHDYDLDCGAPSFEEALCELARLVAKKYGTP